MIKKNPNYQERIDKLKQTLDSGCLSIDDAKKAKSVIAGMLLEKEMAYYLNIAFEGHDDILVFNDLKVEHAGNTAQIDHLVLTCYSAYFIESKSVAGSLQVNEYGEWTRWYGKKPVNIESPLLQSKRHEKILFDFLKRNVDKFMGKIFGFQKKLGSYTPHHYIAVSTKCNITGNGREQLKENLKKADQITEAILGFHNEHAKGYLASFKDANDDDRFKTMTRKELLALGDFLLTADVSDGDPFSAFGIPRPPVAISKEEPPQTQESLEAATASPNSSTCPECGKRMEIWSKYGYFWKCTDCGKSVAIKESCPKCKKKMKVRKQKNQYFIGCKECGIEDLYYSVE